MPRDDELPGDERMRSDLAGEPLTASVRDILDEHAETERRIAEEREAEEAEREQAARRKAEEEENARRRASGGPAIGRGERAAERAKMAARRAASAAGDAASNAGRLASTARDAGSGVDPRLLLGGALLGLVLAGGMRRVLLIGALAAGAWVLCARVLEPARDPATALR